MKQIRFLSHVGLVATLAASLATGAARAEIFMSGQSYYGETVQAAPGARVVDIDTARHLNVRYGETVTFRSGGRQFSWTFNGLDRRSVDVAKIAPAGFSAKPFVVYIAENPMNHY